MLDFTIRLNPPVKSIILRSEPIIFRSCSKRQRVAADHLKSCSSIIRNTATQTGTSRQILWQLTHFLSVSWCFSRRDFFDITAFYPAELLPHKEREAGLEPATSGTPSNRLIAVTVFFNGKGLYGVESDSCISLSLPYIYIITYFF
jgi:hypothetical protein